MPNKKRAKIFCVEYFDSNSNKLNNIFILKTIAHYCMFFTMFILKISHKKFKLFLFIHDLTSRFLRTLQCLNGRWGMFQIKLFPLHTLKNSLGHIILLYCCLTSVFTNLSLTLSFSQEFWNETDWLLITFITIFLYFFGRYYPCTSCWKIPQSL